MKKGHDRNIPVASLISYEISNLISPLNLIIIQRTKALFEVPSMIPGFTPGQSVPWLNK